MTKTIKKAKATFLCGISDRGTVQKVIVLPRDDLQTEELVLEEVEVFKVSIVVLVQSSCFCPECIFHLSVTEKYHFHYSVPAHVKVFTASLQVPTPITTMKISSKRVSCFALD